MKFPASGLLFDKTRKADKLLEGKVFTSNCGIQALPRKRNRASPTLRLKSCCCENGILNRIKDQSSCAQAIAPALLHIALIEKCQNDSPRIDSESRAGRNRLFLP